MFCPQCGSNQSDELKFCKTCGANLQALREVMTTGPSPGKLDWNKTWVAEMFMNEREQLRRKAELEQMRGLTPEARRRNEIKAGVITGSVGLGVMVVLYMIMQGIILGGKVPHDTAEILSRIWVAGVIPMLVGLALVVNGVFVSKRSAPVTQDHPADPTLTGREENRELRPAVTTEFPPRSFSVTEGTTKHLSNAERKTDTPLNNN